MIKNFLLGLLVLVIVVSFNQQALAQSEGERSPLLYGLGSFFIPGLGQLLQGEPEKAVIHFGMALTIPIAGWIATLASPLPEVVSLATGLVSVGWGILSGIDAYRLAQQYNDDNGFGQLNHGLAYQMDFPF